MVPNSAFLQQPFMILEDSPVGGTPPDAGPGPASSASSGGVNGSGGAGGYAEWQSYVNGMPVHQELAREAAGQAPVQPAGAAAPPPEFLQQQAQQAQQYKQHPGQQHGAPPSAAAAQQQPFSQQGVVPSVPHYQQTFHHMHGPPFASVSGMNGWAPQPGAPTYQPPPYAGGAPTGQPMPPYL